VGIEPLLTTRGFAALCQRVATEGLRVTERQPDALIRGLILIEDDAALAELGVKRTGAGTCHVAVTSLERRIGNVVLDANGEDNFFVIDNARMVTGANMAMRFHRSNSVAFFAGPTGGILNLSDIFMRSPAQWLYWGEGATAVGARISIEGERRGIVIGDDCMLSSDVAVSNHDMHTLFDIETEEIINAPPVDMVLEQHVWLGEGATLLGAERVGFGTVVAGGAFVKGTTAPLTVVGGLPAKVLRTNVSWCRAVREVDPSTRDRLARLIGNGLSTPREEVTQE
jgi:hypothetical protein